jgi:hypothetical protein
MCERALLPLRRGRRFPSRRFHDHGLIVPAPRPLTIPAPHRPPPPPLTETFDGEPAAPWDTQVAP